MEQRQDWVFLNGLLGETVTSIISTIAILLTCYAIYEWIRMVLALRRGDPVFTPRFRRSLLTWLVIIAVAFLDNALFYWLCAYDDC